MAERTPNEGVAVETDDLVHCECVLSATESTRAERISVSDQFLRALLGEAYKGGSEALRRKIQATQSWSRLATLDMTYQPVLPPEAEDVIAKFFLEPASSVGYAAGLAQVMRRKRLLLLVALFHKVNRRTPSQAELIELDQSR